MGEQVQVQGAGRCRLQCQSLRGEDGAQGQGAGGLYCRAQEPLQAWCRGPPGRAGARPGRRQTTAAWLGPAVLWSNVPRPAWLHSPQSLQESLQPTLNRAQGLEGTLRKCPSPSRPTGCAHALLPNFMLWLRVPMLPLPALPHMGAQWWSQMDTCHRTLTVPLVPQGLT